jgi:hypothetical protein
MKLPNLEPGQTYRRAEVETYIALQGVQRGTHRTDDYTVAISGFPNKNRERGLPDLKLWKEGQGREIVMEYHLFDIERFASWFDLVRTNLASANNAHRIAQVQKIEAIKEKLKRAEPAYPVWIEKHLLHCTPIAVREGTHRLIAFAGLEMKHVPVFLLKYEEK